MRTWKLAAEPFNCGLCARKIPVGQPLLLIQPGLKRPKKRCQQCAGEAVPENLEIDEVSIPSPNTGMTRLSSVPLPFDFKRAQAGE